MAGPGRARVSAAMAGLSRQRVESAHRRSPTRRHQTHRRAGARGRRRDHWRSPFGRVRTSRAVSRRGPLQVGYAALPEPRATRHPATTPGLAVRRRGESEPPRLGWTIRPTAGQETRPLAVSRRASSAGAITPARSPPSLLIWRLIERCPPTLLTLVARYQGARRHRHRRRPDRRADVAQDVAEPARSRRRHSRTRPALCTGSSRIAQQEIADEIGVTDAGLGWTDGTDSSATTL